MVDDLIIEAERYCEAAGIKLSTLGQYAVSDKTLFTRLIGGGTCHVRTVERVRAYMAENPTTKRERDAA